MSDDVKAIARVENTQLAAYGEREQVGEIVDRLMKLHPQADEVGLHGMRAVAQLAILVGASPLPATNEIHVWKAGSKIQMQLGINYYRRMAEQWGGVFWKVQPRPMTDQERETYGIPQQQLAAICTGIKVDDMLQYKEQGFTANEVWQMTARTGIGVCGPGDAKNGRPAVWTAFKRAEVDLYRQLFPTQMATIERKKPDMDGVPVDAGNHVKIVSYDGTEPTGADMSIEEINADLFPNADPEANKPVNGVYQEMDESPEPTDVDEDAVKEAEEVAKPTAQENRVIDLRASLQETKRPMIGDVCDLLVATGLYENTHHAFEALKKYPEYPPKYKVARGNVLKTEGALALYDWGVDRKIDEEE